MNLLPSIARDLASGLVSDYEADYPVAVTCFMDDFKAYVVHLRTPVAHRRATRTTNLLKRLVVEERRRLKIIPDAWGEKAVLKFMVATMIRASERWRTIKFSDFERRQMAAVRKGLDQENEVRNGFVKDTSIDASKTKLSSRNRT